MLWVLKRTISMRRFFWAPKHMLKLMGKKIFTFLRWKILLILDLRSLPMKFEFNLPNNFWEKIVLIHWWDSNILRSLYIKYELNWSSGFRGEDVWKCWRTDGCWGRMTDRARVTGILLAHPWAFGSGELKMLGLKLWKIYLTSIFTFVLGAPKNLSI